MEIERVSATMNRLIGRESNRGRYSLLANDWNNNAESDQVSNDDPRPDKRYLYNCIIVERRLSLGYRDMVIISVSELADDSRLDGNNMTKCGRQVGGKHYFVAIALGNITF